MGIHQFLQSNPPCIRSLFSGLPYYGDEYAKNIFSPPTNFIRRSAVYIDDFCSTYVNVVDGIRVTVECPERYEHTAHIFGPSYVYGYGCEDKHTSASLLQSLLNARNMAIRVINHGAGGNPLWNVVLRLKNAPIEKNDHVFIFYHIFDLVRPQDNLPNLIQDIQNFCRCRGAKLTWVVPPLIWRLVNPSAHELDLEGDFYDGFYSDPIVNSVNASMRFQHPVAYAPDPLVETCRNLGFDIVDLQPLFNRPHDMEELFCDRFHWTYKGNEKIADILFCKLEEGLSCRTHSDSARASRVKAPEGVNEDMEKIPEDLPPPTFSPIYDSCLRQLGKEVLPYMVNVGAIDSYAEKNKDRRFTGMSRIGAIVMNANPFTNGHLYLIEEAVKRVDGLYIFVVETDQSHFSFAERFMLVKAGTAHIKSPLRVIPSGKYVISSSSFPGYFTKETVIENVDSSFDALLFANLIAPKFGITDRFVGDEPTCKVTSAYNQELRKHLLVHNINLHIFERSILEEKPVSASQVRENLAHGNLEKIKQLVPITTYNFLARKSRRKHT
jgi:cytidyltransferase-like protein